MADVENIRLQMNEIEVRKSSVRQTPLTSFGERLKTGLAAAATVVQTTAASAGYAIPGAAVVGAAVSGLGTVRDISGGQSVDPMSGGLAGGTGMGMGYPMEGGGSISGGSYAGSGGSYGGGGYLNAVASRAAGGDAPSQMMMATQQMQEMNQAFNLQYLQLQQKMQSESRDYTAMSNIMKTKHDTARNALSNLK